MRFFVQALIGLALTAMAFAGVLIALVQPDAGRFAAVAGLTAVGMTACISFVVDQYFDEGQREGRTEAENFRKGLM